MLALISSTASAECTSDAECAHLGAGATCNEQTGLCYGPCGAGTFQCGDSTQFCVKDGNKCCADVGFPGSSCPPAHVCCDHRLISGGGGLTCETSQGACEASVDEKSAAHGGGWCDVAPPSGTPKNGWAIGLVLVVIVAFAAVFRMRRQKA